MSAFRFSRRAEADLLSIGDYTLRTWGKAQAARYLGELEVCCQTLSDNPALGRLCDEVRPGLRRLEHGKHVVFYRQERGGILVSRILHQCFRQLDLAPFDLFIWPHPLVIHHSAPGRSEALRRP